MYMYISHPEYSCSFLYRRASEDIIIVLFSVSIVSALFTLCRHDHPYDRLLQEKEALHCFYRSFPQRSTSACIVRELRLSNVRKTCMFFVLFWYSQYS